jgi:hypothetical protein
MAKDTDQGPQRDAGAATPDAIGLVSDALARLRFGAIQLTVHEGKLVQMEVTEKRRFA